MFPATRQAVDRISARHEPDARIVYDEVAGHVNQEDLPRLELKRRYQMQLIRQMLQDAGYAELAQMTRAKNI